MLSWSFGLIKSAANVAASVPSAVGLPGLVPKGLKTPAAQTVAAEVAASDASLELIDSFDERWKAISKNSEALAVAAAAEDHKFERVKQRCGEELAYWQKLQAELNAIPSFIGEIVSLRAELEETCMRMEQLDAALEYHLDVKAAWDLETWKLGTEHTVIKHQQKKKKELAELERALQYRRAQLQRAKEDEQARLRRSQPLAPKTSTGVAGKGNPNPPSASSRVNTSKSSESQQPKKVSSAPQNPAPSSISAVATEENELELDPDLLDALEALEASDTPPPAESLSNPIIPNAAAAEEEEKKEEKATNEIVTEEKQEEKAAE